MKGKPKKKARAAAFLAAVLCAFALCACGNLFSADSDQTDTRVAVSSDVAALLDEAGIQVKGWTLCCYFASGDYMEKSSSSGAFSLSFPDSDVVAVFARPDISSPEGLEESAVPNIGAIYPYYGELEGGAFSSTARLELDFYGGVAAEAARLIFLGAESPSDAERLVRAFNWSKFDNHIKTAARAVSYPLLINMEKFLTAFFEGNTSMYWQVRSLETEETQVSIPSSLRSSEAAGVIFPYYYPDYNLELEDADGNGALPETITLELPDGLWFFFIKGSRKWLAVQAEGGEVSASYSSDDI